MVLTSRFWKTAGGRCSIPILQVHVSGPSAEAPTKPPHYLLPHPRVISASSVVDDVVYGFLL
jgi:hypothetical protein